MVNTPGRSFSFENIKILSDCTALSSSFCFENIMILSDYVTLSRSFSFENIIDQIM